MVTTSATSLVRSGQGFPRLKPLTRTAHRGSAERYNLIIIYKDIYNDYRKYINQIIN